MKKFKEAGHGEHEALRYSTLSFFVGALLTHMLDVFLTMVSLRHARSKHSTTKIIEKEEIHDDGRDALSQHSGEEGSSVPSPRNSQKLLPGEIEAFPTDSQTADNSIDKVLQPEMITIPISQASSPDKEMPPSLVLFEHDTDELLRMGFLSAVVIFVHNIPEGLATFVTTIANPHAGAAVAFAVALHNIPEASQTRAPLALRTDEAHILILA